MVKKVLLLTCLLLLMISNCFASNTDVPTDLQRWRLLGFGKDGLFIFLDTYSYHSYGKLHNLGHNRCRMADVWEWHSSEYHNSEDVFYTINNITYDFDCKTLQVNRIVEYDKDKNCVGNFTLSNQPVQVVPGSLGERLLYEVERYDKQRNS